MAEDTKSYYDPVDEEAYAQSATNRSEPDPATRDLWQSANISTDGNGPGVDEVAPIFAQARADQLAHPVTADGDDEALADEQSDEAKAAQEKADALRNSPGFVAATGPAAGVYDDPKLEAQIPAENFSPAPEPAEGERSAADVAESERLQVSGAAVVDTTEVDQVAPATDVAGEEPITAAEVAKESAPAKVTKKTSAVNTEANPPVSTPEAPTSNE